MIQPINNPIIKGSTAKYICAGLVGVSLGSLGLYLYNCHKQSKQPQHAKLYLFCDFYGDTFSLTGNQLVEIKEQDKNNVLMSVISEKYGLTILQISQVLRYVRKHNFNNILKITKNEKN